MTTTHWVDDSTVTNCADCNDTFSFFKRKHHCRICGNIYCNNCSQYRVPIKGQDERACKQCYKELRQKRLSNKQSTQQSANSKSVTTTNTPPSDTSANETVLYHTYSICARCVINDKRSKQWKPAIVYTSNNQVYFRLNCNVHTNSPVTLLCSNAAYWQKLNTANALNKLLNKSTIVDVEELTVKYKNNEPLMIELDLYKNGQICSHSTIERQLYNIMQQLTSYSRIVKLNVGLFTKQQLIQLSDTLQFIHKLTHKYKQLIYFVQCDYFRLVDLLSMQRSVFLHPQFYPCVQYHMCAGEEAVFVEQMQHVVQLCESYDSIQLIVSITVQSDYPDFEPVFNVIKQYKHVIRCAVLTRERSTSDLINSITNQNDTDVIDTDIYQLLQRIDTDTKHTLSPDDCVPLHLAATLSTALSTHVNLPMLNLQMAPACVLASYMLNTQHTHFTPLARLLDLYKLQEAIQPVLQQIASNGLGLTTGKQLQRAVTQCAKAGQTRAVEQLYNELYNNADILSTSQLLLIHNKMDIQNGDAVRLCQSGIQSPSVSNVDTLVPACTNYV